jgi:hypothetical protein
LRLFDTCRLRTESVLGPGWHRCYLFDLRLVRRYWRWLHGRCGWHWRGWLLDDSRFWFRLWRGDYLVLPEVRHCGVDGNGRLSERMRRGTPSSLRKDVVDCNRQLNANPGFWRDGADCLAAKYNNVRAHRGLLIYPGTQARLDGVEDDYGRCGPGWVGADSQSGGSEITASDDREPE